MATSTARESTSPPPSPRPLDPEAKAATEPIEAAPTAAASVAAFPQVQTTPSFKSRPSSSPHLRFRTGTMGKPSTISEEGETPPLPPRRQSNSMSRRASSFMSDSSFDRTSLRSSTNDLLRPRPDHLEELHEEPSGWNSLPLAFALIPALGGVLFQRGALIVTDVMLLVFAAIYLNWCLVTPWYWYHAAQTIKLAKPPITETLGDTVNGNGNINGDAGDNNDPHQAQAVDDDEIDGETNPGSTTRDAAMQELQLHEISALALCFIGPLLGAYVLHMVRRSLSEFTDDLVSGLHLTLFVLAAELRPLRYCLKMVQARTIHLQRVVREDPHAVDSQGHVNNELVEKLEQRLAEAELVVASLKSPSSNASADAISKTQTTMQSQIDALNRAVRRYEKRATAQTMQNEARLQDLESRLRDALSLAAAAASYGQEPGVIQIIQKAIVLSVSAATAPFRAIWASVSLPFRLGSNALVRLLLSLGLVQDTRPRKQAPRPKQKADRLAPRPVVKQR